MFTDTPLPKGLFQEPHRWVNDCMQSRPSYRGASPRTWGALLLPPPLGASLSALHQVYPVFSWQESLSPGPGLTMYVWAGGDPPISSGQICSQDSSVRPSLQPFPPCAFVSWHKADGYIQARGSCAHLRPWRGEGLIKEGFQSPD